MNKSNILDNVSQFSAEEIADFIANGTVTMRELQDTGEFPAPIRKKVEKLLEGREDSDWSKAKSENTIEGYTRYLECYQVGSHRDEARGLIDKIKSESCFADAWAAVDKSSVSALTRFADDYPQSSFASQAKEILERLDRDIWNAVDKEDLESLSSYCANNPHSPFVPEARKLISDLQRGRFLGEDLKGQIKRIFDDKRIFNPANEVLKLIQNSLSQGKISKRNILTIIEDDTNVFHADVIRTMLNEGIIDYSDLLNIGIEEDFIRNLVQNKPSPVFPPSVPLVKISRQKTTEVYFWGIPASGKSCALGAIMSVAKSGRVAEAMVMDNKCQGYGYMNRLSSLFRNGQVGSLPGSTATSSISEMAFDLIDKKNNEHSVTCIDLAGELVRCMYKYDTKEEPLTDQEEQTLETLTRILTDNRKINTKIHFFVIEYGGEDKMYGGVPQSDYLAAALRYIETTGIIAKDTDAIFLIITKVDKAKADRGQLHDVLKEYVKNSDAYRGFYNGLGHICQKYEINNGSVPIFPFSLGKVCFQSYCLFDEQPASYVVDTILKYTRGNEVSLWGKFKNIFVG